MSIGTLMFPTSTLPGRSFTRAACLMAAAGSMCTGKIRQSMTETDIETIIQRARVRYPDARPRVISDNGPQFIAKDYKEFIRLCGMTHVKNIALLPAEQRED
jgi:putative transposase